jgi:hypothetical protein
MPVAGYVVIEARACPAVLWTVAFPVTAASFLSTLIEWRDSITSAERLRNYRIARYRSIS